MSSLQHQQIVFGLEVTKRQAAVTRFIVDNVDGKSVQKLLSIPSTKFTFGQGFFVFEGGLVFHAGAIKQVL